MYFEEFWDFLLVYVNLKKIIVDKILQALILLLIVGTTVFLFISH